MPQPPHPSDRTALPPSRRARLLTGAAVAVLVAAGATVAHDDASGLLARLLGPAVASAATAPRPAGADAAPAAAPAAIADLADLVGDSLLGTSGAVRARFVGDDDVPALPALRALVGDGLSEAPSVHAIADGEGEDVFHVVRLRPFADKVKGRIGGYRLGTWSAERRAPRSPAYAAPAGFIEVHEHQRDLAVSEHFTVGQFLTKNQHAVWPKYLVLREPLLDKLELLIDELEASGVRVPAMAIMSGFRTPDYNAQGVGAGGRASESRHTYGDAADVYVHDGHDNVIDLNGDGRVDIRDARVIAQAAERVEARHPHLVGGIGIYAANSAHGPFVHVDVRGTRARWGAW